jgi:hypothetical protein
MDDRDWSENLFKGVVLLLIGVLITILLGLAFGVNQTAQANEYFKNELGAKAAIIKSPAIIIVCETYTEFKSQKGQVFHDNYSFYKIPDSYIGYKWTPLINITWTNVGFVWELTNK